MNTCPTATGETLDNEQIYKLREKVPSDEELYTMAGIFKAISDPTRLKIIYLLRHGELCACEIIAVLEKPQPTVSHHLSILKNVGLLKWRKEGIWMHYQLSDPQIIEIIGHFLKK